MFLAVLYQGQSQLRSFVSGY